MNQISQFFITFTCAAAISMAVALGLLFLISQKKFALQEKLQKFFGSLLILLSLHVLVLNLEHFIGTGIAPALLAILSLADLGFLIVCTVHIIHSSPFQHSQKPENEKFASSGPKHAQDACLPGPLVADQLLPEACSPEASLPEKEMQEDELIEDADSENVEQLEDPGIDDFYFFQKVEALMVNEQLYCEPDLSREDVAAAIGTNRTYLARSIKSATGKTFSEYITSLRTVYAAKLLTTTDEPLDMIGTLVGFRSRSAYYRAFSAAYGCSPSDYRKNSVCFHTLEKKQ